MRLVYLGTPGLAVPPLTALHEAGFEIPLVISAADKRRGRGSKLSPSPVKAAALDLGLAVSDNVDDLLEVEADLGVVVAYGRLIRPHLLAELNFVNLHFSLLPRWRGAAPVERAILSGDAETGVCLMQLEEGLDTGPVYRREVEPIHSNDTLESLRNRLIGTGSTMLVDALQAGLGEPEVQAGEPVYASKLSAEDFRLDLAQPAEQANRVIRVGRAWCEFRGKRFRIWEANVDPRTDLAPGEFAGPFVGTGVGALELVRVQPEGKPQMDASSWLNGAQPTAEDRLQ